MAENQVPGTVWASHGSWHWRIRLPGDARRRDILLTFPFSGRRIPADAPRSVAVSAAFRLWEREIAKTNPDGTGAFTLNELVDLWQHHAADYYRDRDGNPTRTDSKMLYALRILRELYGNRPVEALTHPDMLAFRDRMIADGYARSTINSNLSAVRVMFAWALDEAKISATCKAELSQVRPLKPFRSAARETEPVRAVPDDVIERTCAVLPESLADLVRIHRLAGMRPDEACRLRWDSIERCGDVWAFRPGHHKNEWRNQVRVVALGPRAQAILAKYDGAAGFIFSPARAIAERAAKMREDRRSELREGEDSRRESARRAAGMEPRKTGERWNVRAYARAISRACALHGIPHWSPNQLRHSCATAVRRALGIGACRAVLGHSNGMRVTDRYSFEAAEDEALREASPAARQLG